MDQEHRDRFQSSLEFMGMLSNGSTGIPDLRFTVMHSELNRRQPCGYIVGRRKDFLALKDLFARTNGNFGFASIRIPHRPHVHSDKCTLTSISWRSDLTESEAHTIAQFTCFALTIEDDLSDRDVADAAPRTIAFRIDGAYGTWPAKADLEWSIMSQPQPLDYGNESFNTQVRIVRLSDKALENRCWQLFAPLLIIQCSTALPESQFGRAEFTEASQRYVDDLCLLISMLAGRFTYWFSFCYDSQSEHIEHLRAMTKARDESEIYPELIERWLREEFLHVALPKLRQLRTDGKEIGEAIAYYVSASAAPTVETAFAAGFLSLEKLADVFKEDLGLGSTLPRQEFSRLKENLIHAIAQSGYPEATSRLIKSKLGELNRPPLKHRVRKLIEQNIEDQHQTVFLQWLNEVVETRNRMFHRADVVDVKNLVIQSLRLKVLLGWLLIRILGWSDALDPRFLSDAQGPDAPL